MRRAAKKDRNHHIIARHLASLGYRVCDLSRLGYGVPDLLVAGINRATGLHQMWLIEVKMPGEALTPAERTFHDTWAGDVAIIENIAAVEQLVGIM